MMEQNLGGIIIGCVCFACGYILHMLIWLSDKKALKTRNRELRESIELQKQEKRELPSNSDGCYNGEDQAIERGDIHGSD